MLVGENAWTWFEYLRETWPLHSILAAVGLERIMIAFRFSRVCIERTVLFPLVLLQSEFPIEMKKAIDGTILVLSFQPNKT